MAISDEQREEFHRRYEERLHEIRASRPENWDTMSQEERDRYSGFHTMTEEEVAERYGSNTTNITFFGPHHGEEEGAKPEVETEGATASQTVSQRSLTCKPTPFPHPPLLIPHLAIKIAIKKPSSSSTMAASIRS